MKLLPLLLLSFLLTYGGIAYAQTTGGPDTFGYHWANNLDPIGSAPVYNWVDIKDTANLISGLGDDNSVGPFNLGFYFAYYGQWYNTLWVGSNGWVSFQNAGNITAPFPVIPTPSAPDNIIAGLMADLTLVTNTNTIVPDAAVYFWTNQTDSIIIQYDSVPFWTNTAPGYSGRNTFQIVLTGDEYSIEFKYKQIINSTPSYSLTTNGLKTGIEDSTGNDGLQVLSDTFPVDSSVVKFYYPGHFSTNDIENSIVSLGQNFPNPANDLTAINYFVKKSENIKISVRSLMGIEIDATDLGKITAGNHSFTLHTHNYPAGVYFYSFSAGGITSSGKMVVLR